MYIGGEAHAKLATSESTRFQCIHCGYECDAIVTGIGEGYGRSPYFLDDDGADRRANQRARGQASENMHFALRAAKCPKCGKHDGAASRYVYFMAALRGVGLGGLIGIVAVAALKGSAAGWGLGISIAAVIALFMTITRAQRMLTGAILHPN